MSNPKFAVGDLVAVCSSDLSVVIPSTIITARKLTSGGPARDLSTREIIYCGERWQYQVEDFKTVHRGNPVWINERCLRPILPDEYDEDTQDIRQPITEGAV
jgi:hypothetical protein